MLDLVAIEKYVEALKSLLSFKFEAFKFDVVLKYIEPNPKPFQIMTSLKNYVKLNAPERCT